MTLGLSKGRKGKKDFSKEEIMNFLDLMEEWLPIAAEEWKSLTEKHNSSFGLEGRNKRDIQSLRRKYRDLWRMKVPPEDPKCPEEVKLAKKIYWQIANKATAVDTEDELDGEDEENPSDNGYVVGAESPPLDSPNLGQSNNQRSTTATTSEATSETTSKATTEESETESETTHLPLARRLFPTPRKRSSSSSCASSISSITYDDRPRKRSKTTTAELELLALLQFQMWWFRRRRQRRHEEWRERVYGGYY